MAQFLTLLSILLLVAVFNPDKYESSALAVPGSEEDGVINESGDDNEQHECLEKDESSIYCNKLRNYPDKEMINKLINEKYPHFKKFFNTPLVPTTQNITYRKQLPIKEFVCSSRSKAVFPEGVFDEDAEEWIPVIQTKEYEQGFAVEECVGINEKCGENKGISVPKKYNTICKQHYIKRALLAVRKATIEKGQFKFASCCKCELYEA